MWLTLVTICNNFNNLKGKKRLNLAEIFPDIQQKGNVNSLEHAIKTIQALQVKCRQRLKKRKKKKQ